MLQKLDIAGVLAQEERRGRTRRVLTIAGIVAGIAIVIAGGWLWWSASVRSSAESFATEAAIRGDIHVTLVTTGTLQPTQQVAVTSNVTGTVASVDVDYNQHVTRGQALAHLDMRDLEARQARAAAMVEVQKANGLVAAASLADARAALNRAETLGSGSGVSQRDIDMARTTVQRAEANVASAAAQLTAAQADLQTMRNDYARGTIAAPIDGVVLDINVDPGQNIGTTALGQSLFTVAADLKQLNLEVEIDEADVARVAEGDEARFTVEAAPDAPFDGIIRQIRSAPTVADGVVNYKALILVDNSSMSLRPGMTATVEIAVDEALDVLTVPSAALRFSPNAGAPAGPFGGMIPRSTVETSMTGEQTVWVLTDGKAAAVQVTAGLSDGQRTQILSGALKEGDLVISGTKAR
ncbi:MAG TPA: efflux RND transporter periplasmic adaptor subunit [Hyphomicrobiaceae bacterium]|nr:efflux RND transporter periplasmic adaptor subunit [Hyphomicrobiaceae bacterium]